jgi:hypothetical protein
MQIELMAWGKPDFDLMKIFTEPGDVGPGSVGQDTTVY